MSSYRIQVRATRAEVIAAVLAAKADPLDADQGQIEAEKVAILADIKSIPAEFTGINVLAWGDAFPNQRAGRRDVSGYLLPIDSNQLPNAGTPKVVSPAKPN